MEEENNFNTEELKKETSETVGQVKETLKDMNLKDETVNAKNFVKDMAKDPIGKTSEIANDSDNKFLKTSIFMVIVWMVAKFAYAALSYRSYSSFGRNLLVILKATVAPLCIVFALTLIIYLLNKKNKKSLTSVLSTVTTVYLPMIIVSIINLLLLIDYDIIKIITPVSKLATFITVILSYFAMKDIFEEETELGAFKKFVLVQLIYFGVAIIVSFLGISMYI